MAVSIRVVAAALLVAASFAMAAVASGADLQWAPYGNLAGNSPAFSMAADPGAPGTVFAATLGSGLLRTEDGKTWSASGEGAVPKRLWRVAIDPSKGPNGSPPPIYVGSAGQGFYKSSDRGKSWQQLNAGLDSPGSQNIRAIALGRQMIVIATSDGTYKSADGGKSWQAMGLKGLDVSAVAFAQYSSPTVVLAGIDSARDAGSRLVRTVDLGANWIPLTQGIPNDLVVSALAAGPVPNGANLRPLFVAGSAGIFKSDDGGQVWAQLSGLPPQGFSGLALSPYDPNIVYAASDGGGGGSGGVWRSIDRGGTWTALNGGITEKAVTAIALGRNSPATLTISAYNPDKPLSAAFIVNDTQAAPQGQPEGGVCPEPGTQDQCTAPPVGGPVAVPSAFVPQSACPSPSSSPSAAASASPTDSAPPPPPASASPSASAIPTNPPFGCVSPSSTPAPPPSKGPDLPFWLAGAVLVVLAVILGVRLFLARR